jgi:hypothetical protein
MPINFITSPTPTVVTSGLTLYLDAGNAASYPGTGTTWTDLSGNSNNGTFNTTPTYNSSLGGYFQLNGGQIVQSFPSSISPAGSSRTVMVWFNMADTTRRGLIATRDTNSNGGWAFVLNRNASGNLSYFAIAGGLIETAAGISSNTWYMATATYNYSTTTAQLFINAVSLGTQSSFTADSSSGFNGVAAAEQQNDLGAAFSGKYSIVNIYNRVLSDAEILQNFNFFKSRYGL